ncbi:MAG: amino acid ABC transporter substrate-binding protein [Caulobacter sp.]|nr:amino acid ABC transporter substrate-binding protein [Vitreoscilla sp.]
MIESRSLSRRRWLAGAAAAALVPGAARAQALPDLKGRKVLAVTENAFPPLNMLDPKTGQGVGWEYDCFNEIARRLHLQVEWHLSSWDAMIESVRNGQFDVGMDGIGIDDKRRSQVDFSAPYMRSQMLMLVRADETRFRDPAGFRANAKLLAGAQAGTTGFYTTARDLLGVPGVHPRIKLFDTFGASVQALRAGDVDVVLSDPTGASATLSRSAKLFKVVGTPLPGEDYGFILRKGSPLKAPIDAALATMAADGTLERLNKRWLPALPA